MGSREDKFREGKVKLLDSFHQYFQFQGVFLTFLWFLQHFSNKSLNFKKLIAAYTRTNTNSYVIRFLIVITYCRAVLRYEQHVRTAFDRRHAKTVVINNWQSCRVTGNFLLKCEIVFSIFCLARGRQQTEITISVQQRTPTVWNSECFYKLEYIFDVLVDLFRSSIGGGAWQARREAFH